MASAQNAPQTPQEPITDTLKPKRTRTRKVIETAIVHVEPEVRLGSLAIENPTDLTRRASELAKALADIIEHQKLYVVIRNLKYVKVEGWLTLGAMLGVVPVEDYCRRMPDNEGFESKISLIRAKDGGLVGSASAECTYKEKTWSGRDSYSLRSMSLTRATGKAFRLSFGWIMKLANYEATPAEEMFDTSEGSQEAANKVAADKVAAAGPRPSMFYIWYDESQTAEITGPESLIKANQDVLKKFWNVVSKGYAVNGEQLEGLKFTFEQRGIPFARLKK